MGAEATFEEGPWGAGQWEHARRRHWWRMMAAARRGGWHNHGRFGPGFGPWGGPGGSPFFGRGPRVGRGDVRAAILVLLGERPMHGYQVIQELTERSGGVWRPSPGSVYPTLQQLEDEGLVRGEEADGRRVYRLTDTGRAEVARRGPEEPAPWEVAGDTGPLMDLRDVGVGVAAAVMQVAQTGTPQQVERATEILNETRRRLYGVLSEDAGGTTRGGPGGAPA